MKLIDNAIVPFDSIITKAESNAINNVNMNNLKKINYKNSRSKGKQLFNSNNLGKSISKLTLKKSRSENYFNNEYCISKEYLK
jgi:hypothetical protein